MPGSCQSALLNETEPQQSEWNTVDLVVEQEPTFCSSGIGALALSRQVQRIQHASADSIYNCRFKRVPGVCLLASGSGEGCGTAAAGAEGPVEGVSLNCRRATCGAPAP